MNALEIHDLKKTYATGVEALKGIDLTVAEGDFYALLGPNGAGKSTSIGVVTSLVKKSSGTVKVFGYDIDTDFNRAKSCLGVVPQEFNFSIFETVEQIMMQQAGYYGLPRKLARERCDKYLHKLGLQDKRKAVSRDLSGGMKRRLMIARALLHEPRLLILDEPTAGVDIEIRRSIWAFLREINQKGVTVILTTHYLEEAESLCKNIAIINHGEIILKNSMKKVLSDLHRETFILDLATPIQSVPGLADYHPDLIDESCIEITVHKEQDLNTVFKQLSNNNIQVLSMRNKANRLEELFLGLVTPKEAV